MNKLIYNKSDSERFLILKSFYDNISQIIEYEINISESQIARIEKYYIVFEKIKAYEDFVKEQEEKEEKEFKELFNKAKIFVTHYFQALHMAIERGELRPQTANYYGLNFPFEIPNPKKPEQLIEIAESLFNSDAMRIGSGGKYFANPAIGTVKVWVEKFKEVWQLKNSKFKTNKAEVENIENIRSDSDNLIYEVYELLDNHFKETAYEEKIQIFAKYGLKLKTFVDQELSDKEKLEKETEESVENKKKSSGKTNANQLKFDLFFPEI